MVILTAQLIFTFGRYLYQKLKRDCDNISNEDDSSRRSSFTYTQRTFIYDDWYPLPPDKRKSVYENDLKGIQLHFPFLERFNFVFSQLNSKDFSHFCKIVEFGCSDLKLFPILKDLLNITEMIFVDKDSDILQNNKNRVNPTEDDFQYMRTNPLNIKIFEGCVSKYDKSLDNVDAVLCIELMQTLTENLLRESVKNIFGNIKPKLVIITTPNKEFNPLLNVTSNILRHESHIFEWTRNEFYNWCNEITLKYQEYSVNISGICYAGWSHLDHLGPLTQVAVFHLTENLLRCQHTNLESSYKLIHETNYPFQQRDEQVCSDDTIL